MEKLEDKDFSTVLQKMSVALEKMGFSVDIDINNKFQLEDQYKFYIRVMEALTPLVIHYSASSQCDKCYKIIDFAETNCEINGFGLPVFLCEKCLKKFKK